MEDKYQEVLDNFKQLKYIPNAFNLTMNVSLFEKDTKIFQELVDKETPKKVYKGDYSNVDPLQFGWYHCPNCKKGLIPVSYKKATKLANYCPHCGQRLDWGEDDE